MTIHDIFRMGMDRTIPKALPDRIGTVLNLGAGTEIKNIPGIPIGLPDYDADEDILPFGDNSIAQIHAYHFFEHLSNPIFCLSECQRVLMYEGHINIVVPYYSSSMAAQDLNHHSVFCEDTWKTIFQNPYYGVKKWQFEIQLNIIIGIVERNLCLMTQLIKK